MIQADQRYQCKSGVVATVGRPAGTRWAVSWSGCGGERYVETAEINGWIEAGEWRLIACMPGQHDIRPVDRLQTYAQCVRCWDPGTRRPSKESDFAGMADPITIPRDEGRYSLAPTGQLVEKLQFQAPAGAPRRMADHIRDTLEACSKPYEKPALTPVKIETAAGRELDVLAEALYGLRRWMAGGEPSETDEAFRARCMSSDTLQAKHDSRMDSKDRAELAWWRTQFATRFQPGELPQPGCSLMGRRFYLSESIVPGGATGSAFHVGIDLSDRGDKTAMTLIHEGKVLSVAEIDNDKVAQDVLMKAAGFLPTFVETMTREIDKIVRVWERAGLYKWSTGPITIKQTFNNSDPGGALRTVMQAMEKIGLIAEAPPPPPLHAGDIWRLPDGKLCEVHSAVPGESDLYNCIIDAATMTTSLTRAQVQLGSQRVRSGAPEVCSTCGETKVKGFEYDGLWGHLCPKNVAMYTLPNEEKSTAEDNNDANLLYYCRGRRLELVAHRWTEERLLAHGWCCAIGAVKNHRQQRCPIHEPPAPYGNGEFDTLAFLRP